MENLRGLLFALNYSVEKQVLKLDILKKHLFELDDEFIYCGLLVNF
jgi:hypothetical protein